MLTCPCFFPFHMSSVIKAPARIRLERGNKYSLINYSLISIRIGKFGFTSQYKTAPNQLRHTRITNSTVSG